MSTRCESLLTICNESTTVSQQTLRIASPVIRVSIFHVVVYFQLVYLTNDNIKN